MQADGFAQAPAAVRAGKEEKLTKALTEVASLDTGITALEALGK